MDTVTIGLLLPTSSILPLAKDFDKGFQKGLKSIELETEIEIIREFVGQGNLSVTENALGKLFGYHGVDLVAGVISARVTEGIALKFKNKGVPFIFSELGAALPDYSQLNEQIFINSFHLWQHAWAIGNWGVQTFGKKGMFIGSVYDAGYSFSHMFYEGMMAADSTSQWSFSVPPMPPKDSLSDMSIIFPYLETYQPDFIFAAFCGSETTLFLKEFISRGWHKKTKIIGLPFLLFPYNPLPEDITIYTTELSAAGQSVVPESSFYQLGFNAGTLVNESLQHHAGKSLQHALQKHENVIAFGGINILTSPQQEADTISFIENKFNAGQTEKSSQPLASVKALSVTDEKFLANNHELKFGWMNPYLCI